MSLSYEDRYEELVETFRHYSETRVSVTNTFRKFMNLEMDIIHDHIESLNLRCPPINEIGNVRSNVLSEHINNFELFEWLFCSFNSAYVSAFESEDSYSRENRPTFKTYKRQLDVNKVLSSIREMRNVSSGNYGNVWRAKIQNDLDLAYIKTGDANPRDKEYKDFFMHEFFVGVVLNQLRRRNPNFMYVYAVFNCGFPNGGIPCSIDDNNTGYLIMEKIEPGFKLQELIMNPQTKPEQLMALYLQVILALKIAHDSVGFTHYDLHTGNVIIQTTRDRSEILIPYDFNLEIGKFYIKTRLLAKIIDYGLSRVEKDGMGFGNMIANKILSPIISLNADPLFDIYKFTWHFVKDISMSPMKDYLSGFFYHTISRFHKFGPGTGIENNGDLIDRIQKSWNINHDYTIDKQNLQSNNPYLDQIIHVMENYPAIEEYIIFREDNLPNIQVLDCEDQDCSRDVSNFLGEN